MALAGGPNGNTGSPGEVLSKAVTQDIGHTPVRKLKKICHKKREIKARKGKKRKKRKERERKKKRKKKSIIYIRHCTNEPSSHSSGLQSTRIIGLPHGAGGDGGGV